MTLVTHCVSPATIIKTKCWPLPTVKCQRWVSLAALLVPDISQLCKQTLQQTLCFLALPRIQDVLMWAVIEGVTYLCNESSSAERLWNPFNCRATWINLIWGETLKSVFCGAIVQSVSDGSCAIKKKKGQRLWIVAHAEGCLVTVNLHNGNSVEVNRLKSPERLAVDQRLTVGDYSRSEYVY